MRKVSFGMNISLDGYCDHTRGEPSEELMEYFLSPQGLLKGILRMVQGI